ncbi:hypothetical protein [Microcoleus sp. FACHB-672]|uniref:hypothetical protein n=1 Tax=Microcoleus sp. FACHB-672 TaxID=2692825 RepID=UPI0016849C18|nr:hypothetical protein [Microcoleus sp. FACHB-672]MBD2042785.1 hypothetical protein [Microcoleus sp. FACHB-672]
MADDKRNRGGQLKVKLASSVRSCQVISAFDLHGENRVQLYRKSAESWRAGGTRAGRKNTLKYLNCCCWFLKQGKYSPRNFG